MKTIAIILAAGSGSRLGADIPKQFLEVGGRLVIEYSIDVFDSCDAIDEICIVVNPHFAGLVADICKKNAFRKVSNIIAGGAERADSSRNALDCLAGHDPDSIILFHDAARPLITPLVIGRCIDAMRLHDAVAVGTPATDTIWQVRPNHDIASIPPRQELFNAQTPQCFRLGPIAEAYRNAAGDPAFRPTDDCGVLFRYMPQCRIHVVECPTPNIKVTFKEDLAILESILNPRKEVSPAPSLPRS